MNQIVLSAAQRMPPGQWFTLGDPAVGAGFGQPGQLPDIFCGQLDAGGHEIMALFVDCARTGNQIQITAGDSGQAGLHIRWTPDLIQAANATAIT